MNELFNEIPGILKKSLQDQLKVPRISKTYGGRKKPVRSTGNYPPSPAIASGNLIGNIDVFWRENQTGDPQLLVEMPYYWYWVDEGRRPGKYPPLQVIDRWQIQKGLSGIRDDKGRFIPRKTLTFLRARSIAQYGFKGNQFVSKALKQSEDEILEKFGEAALAYFQDLVNESLAIKIDVKL